MNDLRWPTLDDLDALGALMTRTAPPEFQDMNGHVNVRHHYGMHMDGAAQGFVESFDLGEGWLDRTGQSAFSVEHHITFHSEILVGHEVSVHLRMLGRSDKAMHAMTILLDRSTGKVASTLEYVEVYVDLTTRRATAMPEELTKPLDALLEEHADLDWDLPRSRAMGTSRG
ncbi:thioesterase family protein [Mumia sp. DW29H23]|uniref:thioesterase family protein n=1 Tax=Mumia sp. DW29H23 TaxID=3421241 RepID=UPI003D698C2D